ncbi:DUF6216 family protein [Pseudomonas eucalypticola]|uniref:Uncharacterized protein n=1 Tax=Pseudomonas eucalypticola TaxID=2599595 RepID=A0A7D5HFI9_9PSED|nr:DUF6216 family protein [Pseudomonas eucalypticola]QKZ04046.1 hypothetical protein HWQ56_09730 [Pseudomonas eucalypticola]
MNDQTFTSLMHWLDILYKLWPIACGIAVIAIVWSRTRSPFFVFHQALKWLGLEGKYTCEDDQKVADDYLDLNKFNLKTGFQLRSVKAKRNLHQWMREHELEFPELRRAGRLFKANDLTFDVPGSLRRRLTQLTYVAFAGCFMTSGLFVANSDYALLKINATGTWFWAGKNEAYSVRFEFPEPFRGDAWRMQQGDCRYTNHPQPNLDIWESDVICQLVVGFGNDFVSDAISSQLKMAVALELLGLLMLGLLVRFMFWVRSAGELQAQLHLTPPAFERESHGKPVEVTESGASAVVDACG